MDVAGCNINKAATALWYIYFTVSLMVTDLCKASNGWLYNGYFIELSVAEKLYRKNFCFYRLLQYNLQKY